MAEDTRESFPWHLGVYDAHCHPTDTMSSISSIPNMKARILTIMATRSQDQDLVFSVAESHAIQSSNPEKWSQEQCMLPSFGWHPWFSHQMYIPTDKPEQRSKTLQGDEKIEHYRAVFQPRRKQDELSEEERRLFLELPDPTPFTEFLAETRTYLEKYPYALVGEIGLDRSFRVPYPWMPMDEARQVETPGRRDGKKLSPFRVDLQHQKKLFKMQLQLAAEMGRAVSIHSVQAHGVVFETLKELYTGHEKKVLSKKQKKKVAQDQVMNQDGEQSGTKETDNKNSTPFPPRICLHSYSGDVSLFKTYLNPAIPIDIFISLSTAINCSDDLEGETPQAIEDLIKLVPDNMLLVESDLHTAGEAMDLRLEDIVRRICRVKGWGLEEGVRLLGRNWRRFVFGAKEEVWSGE